jgi:hypothetical protein
VNSKRESRQPEEPDDLAGLRAEIDQVERSALRRIDPGGTALVIAVGVLVLLLAAVLPWAGGTSGLEMLLGQWPPGVGVLPKVFTYLATGFGVLASVLGLITRRWGMSWVCALGCWLALVVGVLSIWSQQTTHSHQPGPGPGAGLVLAVVSLLVLAISWFRIAWSRPSVSQP